jgi:hypothetical protein
MNPVQEFKQACKKHHIQDVTFVCRDDAFPEEALHIWQAVIPFNACFSHCRGIGPTKQLAKEACALQALPLCQGYASVWDTVYNPMIQLCITGGNKIGRNRTPYICVPRYNFPIEHCAASAFNAYDAAKRCRENLDKMLSKMAESFDEIQTRKYKEDNDDDDDDETEEEDTPDEDKKEELTSNDINEKIIAVTDEMLNKWSKFAYCQNCACEKCKTKRPQKVETETPKVAKLHLVDASELFTNQNEPEYDDEYTEFKEAVRLAELDNPNGEVHCITRKTGEKCVAVFSRPDVFSNHGFIPFETKPKHYDGKPVYYFDTLSLSVERVTKKYV